MKRLVSASWAKSTQATYNSELKKWYIFCQEKGEDPNIIDFDIGLRFLVWLHDVRKANYATIASTRSVIWEGREDQSSGKRHV